MRQVQKYLETRIDILNNTRGGKCRDSLKRAHECMMAKEIVEKYIPRAEGFQDDKARKQIEAASKKKAEEHAKEQQGVEFTSKEAAPLYHPVPKPEGE